MDFFFFERDQIV